MVAMLLLPDTAKQWLGQRPAKAAVYQAGAQTLFTDKFAKDCVQAMNDSCDGIEVWTGYNPPIGALATKPGIAEFVSDVRRIDQNVEVNNQFLMGSYLGMSVFVEALKKAGPNLSREALRDAMNSMTFQTDLTSTLTWTANDHKSNKFSQSFAMRVGQGSFQGWEKRAPFQRDPVEGV
jgi:ABC-type branched-subunit amino acid transport system substrate-binding protein